MATKPVEQCRLVTEWPSKPSDAPLGHNGAIYVVRVDDVDANEMLVADEMAAYVPTIVGRILYHELGVAHSHPAAINQKLIAAMGCPIGRRSAVTVVAAASAGARLFKLGIEICVVLAMALDLIGTHWKGQQ